MVNARVYIDHAATTHVRPQALEAYTKALSVHGNPSSQHASGRAARGIYDDAIAHMAQVLGVPASWLILTSGGTEADNIALRGVRGPVLGLSTDHAAVVSTVKQRGGSLIAVHPNGLIDMEDLEAQLRAVQGQPGQILVSAALVNNETGIIQDLNAIAQMCETYGGIVHTDAVQAIGHVPLPDFSRIPLASLTGHKIGAPVGVGLLIADPRIALEASVTGGGQQRGVRSGTLDAGAAAALAAALSVTLDTQQAEVARRITLAEHMKRGIAQIDPSAHFTAQAAPHSAHIIHVMFPGADQDAILFGLDQRGIDSSAGSACQAGVTQASHVLQAMGVDDSLMRGAVRFSLGHSSTEDDVQRLLAALPDVLEAARLVAGRARERR